ncbi:hypothetical protein KBY28_07610 [Ruegeria pomeroyi]|uniref:hypothetical protein n=1 Tax=Ruegeria pomeroyi TaxID=89184 RepID=UPI001F2A7B10|nr:hypothetical protein [Ruegeria pomeroyi]MCE8508315.1 hypothetical protein [Ruegeria pomeroyi]
MFADDQSSVLMNRNQAGISIENTVDQPVPPGFSFGYELLHIDEQAMREYHTGLIGCAAKNLDLVVRIRALMIAGAGLQKSAIEFFR